MYLELIAPGGPVFLDTHRVPKLPEVSLPKILNESDNLDEVVDLQAATFGFLESIGKTAYLIERSRDQIQTMMKQDVVFGVHDNHQLLAVSALTRHRDDNDRPWAEMVGLSESSLPHVAYSDMHMVSPHSKVRGLQREMLRSQVQMARASTIGHVFATIDPENIACVKNFERSGFDNAGIVERVTETGESVDRVLMYQETI